MMSNQTHRDSTGSIATSSATETTRSTSRSKAPVGGRRVTLKMMLAMPLFGFLMGVIVTEAQYYGTVHNLRALAREAGRATAMAASPEERRWVAQEAVNAAIDGYPLLDGDNITVQVVEDVADPKRHDLTITYAARPLGLWLLAGLTQRSPMTVQQSLTIRQGNY
jgi:hypothetical protein